MASMPASTTRSVVTAPHPVQNCASSTGVVVSAPGESNRRSASLA
jgi:hypothetical protein